jgi:hypothetical protein
VMEVALKSLERELLIVPPTPTKREPLEQGGSFHAATVSSGSRMSRRRGDRSRRRLVRAT